MSNTTTNLLPCPWCGHAPKLFDMSADEDVPRDWVAVQCVAEECSAGPVVCGDTAEEAARDWNRRVPDPRWNPSTPEYIKAEIRIRAHTASSIGDELGVSRTAVANVIEGKSKSARIRQHISQLLGQPISVLWPEKKAAAPGLRRSKSGDRRVAA